MPIPLKLTVHRGAEVVGEEVFDRDIVKIGRLASAHLKLEDTKVSRIHAVIEATSDGQDYSIIDMGSTEGTYLNGNKISKEKLSDGDELTLGDCRIVVSFEGAAASVDAPVAVATSAPEVPPEELWQPSMQEMATAEPTAIHAAASPTHTPTSSPVAPVMTPAMAASQVVPAGAAMNAGHVPHAPMQPGQVPMQPGAFAPTSAMSGAPMAYGQAAAPVGAFQTAPPMPHPGIPMPPPAPQDPWGTVPSNLASDGTPDTERSLEVKMLWGNSVIEAVTVTDKPTITLGDERKISGWGPLQKVQRCDIEAPSRGLPAKSYVLAESLGADATNYVINIPAGFIGQVERADGMVIPLEQLQAGHHGAEPGDMPGAVRYQLRAAETLYLANEGLILQIRYIRNNRLAPPPLMSEVNYTWMNILVLAFFLHTMAIVSFVATPVTQAELTENIFKNPNRFAQFRLTPEEKRAQEKNSLLSKLKEGETGAKAKGKEGKAGRKDYQGKKQGRMAVKGDPDDKEIAKSTLNKLFGGKGNVGRSYLFGSGGLGGELKGALGGVTGAEIGDATGLGGLGTRGTGAGGGGLSMNSVGLGALGTRGRGGGAGGTGYGEGAGRLGKKAERDINISSGTPVIMGSLDKEIIRRVIKQHIAQIRYCYEKELVRSPGLFGKVATQFTISGTGSVQSSNVTESTLGNAEVERCITAKIRTWRFPKPKGGGIVIVKYPFIFKTSG